VAGACDCGHNHSTSTQGTAVDVKEVEVERKPLMTAKAILLMNVGFFGIQFSFGLQQTAVNPLFSLIGAEAHDLPILNLAGPSPALIQPLIGAMRQDVAPALGRPR
jgi:maltose/moltooligosaccharide transporter